MQPFTIQTLESRQLLAAEDAPSEFQPTPKPMFLSVHEYVVDFFHSSVIINVVNNTLSEVSSYMPTQNDAQRLLNSVKVPAVNSDTIAALGYTSIYSKIGDVVNNAATAASNYTPNLDNALLLLQNASGPAASPDTATALEALPGMPAVKSIAQSAYTQGHSFIDTLGKGPYVKQGMELAYDGVSGISDVVNNAAAAASNYTPNLDDALLLLQNASGPAASPDTATALEALPGMPVVKSIARSAYAQGHSFIDTLSKGPYTEQIIKSAYKYSGARIVPEIILEASSYPASAALVGLGLYGLYQGSSLSYAAPAHVAAKYVSETFIANMALLQPFQEVGEALGLNHLVSQVLNAATFMPLIKANWQAFTTGEAVMNEILAHKHLPQIHQFVQSKAEHVLKTIESFTWAQLEKLSSLKTSSNIANFVYDCSGVSILPEIAAQASTYPMTVALTAAGVYGLAKGNGLAYATPLHAISFKLGTHVGEAIEVIQPSLHLLGKAAVGLNLLKAHWNIFTYAEENFYENRAQAIINNNRAE